MFVHLVQNMLGHFGFLYYFLFLLQQRKVLMKVLMNVNVKVTKDPHVRPLYLCQLFLKLKKCYG